MPLSLSKDSELLVKTQEQVRFNPTGS